MEGAEILPYPLQTALVRHLSAPAERAGRRDLLPMWAGQSARLSRCEDVHDFLSALVAQVSAVGGSVRRWSTTRTPADTGVLPDTFVFMYPVVTDNDIQTWKAYNVEAWPTKFLLDKQGRIRWRHVGEGGYDEAERMIQKLLAE